jgi:hypothetical protein
MTQVVEFKLPIFLFPARDGSYCGHTLLVTIFRNSPEMLPFVRYLFDEHGIMSIGHWDQFGAAHLMDRFGLSDQLKRKFAKFVGRPAGPQGYASSGRIMKFSLGN